jgi:hypothetical protein
MIRACKQVPSVWQYQKRFGSLMRAYEVIGYKPDPRVNGGAATRNKKHSSRRKHPAR